MSVSIRAARAEDSPQLFTIEGLASSFGVSTETIRKYITYGHVNRALGRRHDGFNYDITHYRQIKQVRRDLEGMYSLRTGRPRTRLSTNKTAHVVVVQPRSNYGVVA